MLSKLLPRINALSEFGLASGIHAKDRYSLLKRLLVEIYLEFLSIEEEIEHDKEYDQRPEFDYHGIRRNIETNFPDLSWYQSVLNPKGIYSEIQLGIGDAVDDLTDIIKDLLEVKWRIENTSELDALWHFQFLMRAHTEQHLVDLLKYLKDVEV